MYEIDARGLSCPEPVMLTADALKQQKGQVKITVSEVIQKINIEKLAKAKGRTVQINEKGNEFELIID